MHRLLERQIKRFLGDPAALPPPMAAFVAAVDEAYQAADADRLMIERSLELMSKELTETNAGLRKELGERRRAEEAISVEKEEQKALIKKLEEAHNQLLQSEKMASIGQLAAGVAHEINNPIGYVNSNLGTLRTYIDQLLAVLAVYESLEATCEPAKLAQINAVKKKVELDFLKEDVLALLRESGEGIRRVKQIVQDLKDFSHVDEAEWQLADLHHGLDSTLNVVHNEIKYKADVVREYGDLPPVECLPHQINQVFMNLLVNAAHAMKEGQRGRITVRSGTDADQVWVEIADDGKGIAPENLTRIFDPFFTTKPVGKGTGLGLSLAYGIIEKHHGHIEVSSQVGEGTRFRVRLPLKQPEKEVPA
jgi:signal transduction histidine kinase